MPDQSRTTAISDFGPNEWLVDEMYQQYLADPKSVDPQWATYFASNPPGEGGTTGTAPATNGHSRTTASNGTSISKDWYS